MRVGVGLGVSISIYYLEFLCQLVCERHRYACVGMRNARSATGAAAGAGRGRGAPAAAGAASGKLQPPVCSDPPLCLSLRLPSLTLSLVVYVPL